MHVDVNTSLCLQVKSTALGERDQYIAALKSQLDDTMEAYQTTLAAMAQLEEDLAKAQEAESDGAWWSSSITRTAALAIAGRVELLWKDNMPRLRCPCA